MTRVLVVAALAPAVALVAPDVVVAARLKSTAPGELSARRIGAGAAAQRTRGRSVASVGLLRTRHITCGSGGRLDARAHQRTAGRSRTTAEPRGGRSRRACRRAPPPDLASGGRTAHGGWSR